MKLARHDEGHELKREDKNPAGVGRCLISRSRAAPSPRRRSAFIYRPDYARDHRARAPSGPRAKSRESYKTTRHVGALGLSPALS